MILQKIEIEQFGGLKDYTLVLEPGFQYLYGENEAGKSTICAFISVMFYGMPGKVRGGGLKGDYRQLYMPWGEKYMAGRITFEDAGKTYVLKRRFGQTARGDSCNLYHAEDWSEISIEPETIGQRFFGVGEDAFKKSLFISQLGAAFQKGKEDELMERLSNLEHTGEEDASVLKAVEALRQAEHNLISKSGRGGSIAKIDSEIEALKTELAAAKQKNLSFRSLLEDIQGLSGKIEDAKAQIEKNEILRKQAIAFEQFTEREKQREQLKEQKKRIEEEKQALCKAEQDLAALAQEKIKLAAVEAMPSDIMMQMMEKESDCKILLEKEEKKKALFAEIEAIQKEIKETELQTKKRRQLPLFLSGIFFFALGVVLGILIPIGFLLLPVGVILMVLSFADGKTTKQAKQNMAVLCAKLAERQRIYDELAAENISQELTQYREEVALIFKQAGTDSINGLSEKIEEARGLKHKEEFLQKEKNRLTISLENLEKALCEMTVPAEEEPVFYEGETAQALEQKINILQKEQMERERHLVQLSAKAEEGFAGIRGVSLIESELSNAVEQRAELVERYECIRLARETMELCAAELKNSFAPILNEKSSALISGLTDGRYSQVKITDDYKMMLKTPDGHEIVESDFVSAGRCDLLYFALRLAVLQTLYEHIPLLIMDDTFLQMDKNRQQAGFCLLKENPAEQILYFSCHEPQSALSITVKIV